MRRAHRRARFTGGGVRTEEQQKQTCCRETVFTESVMHSGCSAVNGKSGGGRERYSVVKNEVKKWCGSAGKTLMGGKNGAIQVVRAVSKYEAPHPTNTPQGD